jgi:hypothetical protein
LTPEQSGRFPIGRVLGLVTRETWALANALTLTVVDSRVISRSCPQMYF